MAKEYMLAMSMIRCDKGLNPVPLLLPKGHGVFNKGGKSLVNANDSVPFLNIMPFGICRMKPPTPPGVNVCIPVTPLAWRKGDIHMIVDGAPALTKDSYVNCMLGGKITFM